ncbi:hypothetical protein FHS83_001843 [Rhizomicrobium palustre]|uniref:HD domain-containing protein n=1 Tax=Rhizomicrobium palustre TaxID=189966 RepID=A0A846MZ66_9PROT|nr:hypothetical protein [Rhizomicrobium palustre]NIK88525.1 hypothetical protein [Rhizomicrobium palustre]
MRSAFCALLCLSFAAPALGAPANPLEDLAARSPLTKGAVAALEKAVERLPEPAQAETREALFPETGCIAYLKGLDKAGETAILDSLAAEKFITDRAAAEKSLFGYPHAGKTCPARLQSVRVAPGGDWEGHHAWPGGLAVHEASNLHLAENFVTQFRAETGEPSAIDMTQVTAAVVWHDWAKTVEFQWQDGRLINYESKIAGTGSHHILGLAEAMARKMPPRFVMTQACAHDLPKEPGGQNVISWLKAGAIIARVDPVRAGYLTKAADGKLSASFGAECHVNFLSDQSWSSEGPALKKARAVLADVAADYGYAKSDSARYAMFENTALAYYGADALALLPAETVKAKLLALKKAGLI